MVDQRLSADLLEYSVIIPSRARREMLLAALESVFAQTLPPSEVIVVLDGDVDGSAAVITATFPDVRLVLHTEPLGPAQSRADGLAAATSEWVCLLDDDDIWHSGKQEAAYRYLLENPSCHALRSAFWQFSENEDERELNGFVTEIFADGVREVLEQRALSAGPVNTFGYLNIHGKSLEEMLRKNCGVTSSTMFRRELLQQIPEIPAGLRTAEDWLLFVYISALAEWHLVPGRWFFYRVHGSQLTTTRDPAKWQHRVTAWSHAWKKVGCPRGLKLTDYSDEYAAESHRWLWEAVRSRQWKEAAEIYRQASEFIPSKGLRLSTLLPPPVWWRARRLLHAYAVT